MLSEEINDYDRTTQLYLNEIGKYKSLSKREEHNLLILYKECGDEDAKIKLLQANLKFVASVAKDFRGRGLSYMDLISEGNLGMVKALEKFDINQDVKFISYAVWWIRQSIMVAIEKHGTLLAESLPENYEKEESANSDDEDNGTVCDDAYCLTEHADYGNFFDNKNVLSELSEVLTEREKMIIAEYYGLNEKKPKTLEEIGQKLGLTKERVRQINEKSLKKMRSAALTKSITKDIYL